MIEGLPVVRSRGSPRPWMRGADNHGYGGLGGAGPTTSLVVGARGGSDRRPGAGTQMVSPATGRRSQGPKFRSLELSGEPLVGRLCARGEGYRARRELRGVSYG